MIAIIDYGMGNLRSVQKCLEKNGFRTAIVSSPDGLAGAGGIILPGVGAFEDAVVNLRNRGLDRAIREAADEGQPVLGICLGMQLFFEVSEEGGSCEGLGIFSGRVRRFAGDLKVPHMGWNRVELRGANPLFDGIPDGSYFYFVHSYYVEPAAEEHIVGETVYGGRFVSAVADRNVFGVQFHPEKSSELGERLLYNFGKLVESC
ncbi:MAG: imidazole glycerol-phosphate synthase subunit HisH [Clostridia bacterium]|nr:imidazole glycerol-phosphate synthase subunit HisH [Clostridia bacterium]MDN5365068.1 imidazole glycerol-phosphate synthase subunit HisH [Thermacetogenium sp.]MDN5375648.1 imidazole glycerol-phosphate synthase subunit HisH [Thermacetogenium sp.]